MIQKYAEQILYKEIWGRFDLASFLASSSLYYKPSQTKLDNGVLTY